MSDHIHKSHNNSLLLYHFVSPIKYRRSVLNETVSKTFKEVCQKIEERYEMIFLEVGLDENHVHFLIQGVPNDSPKKIIGAVKSITAKEIFRLHPEVKQQLWGGKFWTSGYYVNTVGQYANELWPTLRLYNVVSWLCVLRYQGYKINKFFEMVTKLLQR